MLQCKHLFCYKEGNEYDTRNDRVFVKPEVLTSSKTFRLIYQSYMHWVG